MPLRLLAVLTLVGYVVLSLWFPLTPHFSRSPSPDIRSLAPSLPAAAIYALLLCALVGLYWQSYQRVRQSKHGLPLATILLAAAVFSLPLLLTFPFNATDVYRYFLWGRISSVHHLSPFAVPVIDLTNEPYASLAGEWAGDTSPYGPVWELTAWAITTFVPGNLWLGLLLFKLLAAVTHLAVAGLIWLSLKRLAPAERAGRTLLWAWNPVLLIIFAAHGHNDGLMLVWLLLGWWLTKQGWRQLGLLVMLLGPLTKPAGLLPLPFLLLAVWQELPDRYGRVRLTLLTGLLGLALAWLTFLPFGSPLDLAQRLVGEATSGGGFSLVALIILQARYWGIDPSVKLAVRVAYGLIGLLALWLLRRTWRGRSPLRAAADIFAGFCGLAFRYRIWYSAWLLPWLLLDHPSTAREVRTSRARLVAGLGLLLSSQLSVLIYGQVRTELLSGSQLGAHLIGVPFTFLLPLIAAWATVLRHKFSPNSKLESPGR